MLGSQKERTEGIKRQAQELIDQAYERGFKAGKESEAIAIQDGYYQRGLDDAWEAARKIMCNGGLKLSELSQIFGMTSFTDIFHSFSGSEAIEKIRQYEEQKKSEEEEIKVGDEVYISDRNYTYIVTSVKEYASFFSQNGKWGNEHKSNLTKTGRHFDQIAEVLKQMQEENK